MNNLKEENIQLDSIFDHYIKKPTNKLRERILSQTSKVYLIRHAILLTWLISLGENFAKMFAGYFTWG